MTINPIVLILLAIVFSAALWAAYFWGRHDENLRHKMQRDVEFQEMAQAFRDSEAARSRQRERMISGWRLGADLEEELGAADPVESRRDVYGELGEAIDAVRTQLAAAQANPRCDPAPSGATRLEHAASGLRKLVERGFRDD